MKREVLEGIVKSLRKNFRMIEEVLWKALIQNILIIL